MKWAIFSKKFVSLHVSKLSEKLFRMDCNEVNARLLEES